MLKRAVFLDRDGTVNVDKNYLFKATDFEYLPGTTKALSILQDAGLSIVIITNQSGIARGFFTEKDYELLNEWMIYDLRRHGIEIAATYHCPHGPDDGCNCRKPRTGLFSQAASDLEIDLDSSFVVGDRDRDVSICRSSNAKGFVIYSNVTRQEGNIRFIQGGLLQAAKLILQELQKEGN